jgi:hypothetical protein
VKKMPIESTAAEFIEVASIPAPEPRFEGGYPEWDLLDKIGQNWFARLAWVGAYTAFYFAFATSPWLFILLPFHYVMGPTHGAIVNWCGHKYGYTNYDNGDASRNTLAFDFLTLGELFQNNHHKFAMSPNFAARRFEVDPTYTVIRVLSALRIIELKGGQRMRYPLEADAEPVAQRAAVLLVAGRAVAQPVVDVQRAYPRGTRQPDGDVEQADRVASARQQHDDRRAGGQQAGRADALDEVHAVESRSGLRCGSPGFP